MKAFWLVASSILILTINGYLYRQILQSNKKHRESMQLAVDKASKRARKLDTLRSHIKPTVSLLLLGGLDGLFNLVIPLIQIILFFNGDSVTTVYVKEFLIEPLKWCQLLCNPLVYGVYMTDIRQKIFNFDMYHKLFNHRSKVTVLNRQ